MARNERNSRNGKADSSDRRGLEVTLSAREEKLQTLTEYPPVRNDKALSLLHDHIKDMTSILRRLSRDMERCEATVASNTAAIATLTTRLSGNESLVNNDLDSRINRCDVGIKEVVREMKDCTETIAKMRQISDSHHTAQVQRNETLERRVVELDKAIRNMGTEQNKQISSLKDQTKALGSVSLTLERDVSKDMSQLKTACLNRVELLVSETEARCTAQIETVELRTGEISDTVKKAIAQINSEIDKIKKESEESLKMQSRLRAECMSGFKTLQESVDTMHSIFDSKIRLLEDEVRTEIRKAFQTVVVT